MAVGRSVQLDAVATDGSGNELSGRTFGWQTSDASVASVTDAGLVEGVGAGTATITATAEDVSGTFQMRVVPAELDRITALLEDAYTTQLVGGLSAATGDVVSSALDGCATAVDAGHILDLADCLQAVQDEAPTDGTDRALVAVLGVLALRAQLLLHL